jgi:hypothetical protein
MVSRSRLLTYIQKGNMNGEMKLEILHIVHCFVLPILNIGGYIHPLSHVGEYWLRTVMGRQNM